MREYGLSPLRYPGGKSCLSNFLTEIIELNKLKGGIYYELYAGGSGAALSLLFNGTVSKIVINDADFRIFAFWHSILYNKNKFLALIDKVDVNMEEWQKQKYVYENASQESRLNVGFATFFLNRTNRSGIIHRAGPIGGMKQNGNYLIDVRFHKENLKARINNISKLSKKIDLYNLKAEDFLLDNTLYKDNLKKAFFYLDPPYYYKGKELYLNNYIHDEHKYLATILTGCKIKKWLVSYDNVIEIRKMYPRHRTSKFNLNYSLNDKREATELLIFSKELIVPKEIQIRSKIQGLTVS